MSCFTASYFSSSPTAATNSSRPTRAIPGVADQSRRRRFLSKGHGQYATLAQLTPLRSPKRTVGNSPPDHSSFCEFLYGTPRRQLDVRPALRPFPALRVRSRVL